MSGVGTLSVVARSRVIGDIRMRFGRSRSPTRMGSKRVGMVIGLLRIALLRRVIHLKTMGLNSTAWQSVAINRYCVARPRDSIAQLYWIALKVKLRDKKLNTKAMDRRRLSQRSLHGSMRWGLAAYRYLSLTS